MVCNFLISSCPASAVACAARAACSLAWAVACACKARLWAVCACPLWKSAQPAKPAIIKAMAVNPATSARVRRACRRFWASAAARLARTKLFTSSPVWVNRSTSSNARPRNNKLGSWLLVAHCLAASRRRLRSRKLSWASSSQFTRRGQLRTRASWATSIWVRGAPSPSPVPTGEGWGGGAPVCFTNPSAINRSSIRSTRSRAGPPAKTCSRRMRLLVNSAPSPGCTICKKMCFTASWSSLINPANSASALRSSAWRGLPTCL